MSHDLLKRSAGLTFACCILAILLLTAPAAGTGPAAFQTRKAALKRPVYVTASLVDRNGLYIETLQKNEVEILEGNQPRELEFMARDELPTVYGILFDRAMLPEREEMGRPGMQSIPVHVAARDIAYQLIDKLFGRQALWVGAYDRQMQVVFEAEADGFGAKNAIHQLRGTRASNDSFLYSALFSAVDKMNQRHERRRVIILFIQDLDPQTAGKIKPLKNLLGSSNVELFAVCFASRLGNAGGVPSGVTTSAIKDLTQATAGLALFSMENRDHFEDMVRRLLDHLRTLYTFGFTSQSLPGDDGKLVIKCSRRDSRAKYHPSIPDIE